MILHQISKFRLNSDHKKMETSVFMVKNIEECVCYLENVENQAIINKITTTQEKEKIFVEKKPGSHNIEEFDAPECPLISTAQSINLGSWLYETNNLAYQKLILVDQARWAKVG